MTCKRAYERLGQFPAYLQSLPSEEDLDSRQCDCPGCDKVGYEVRHVESDGTKLCAACHAHVKTYGKPRSIIIIHMTVLVLVALSQAKTE
jgi:hypothetical protein